MRAPRFWWRETPTLAARCLAPFGAVYGTIAARRLSAPGAEAPVPVICVGNFVAGGAGKTPTALALAEALANAGRRPSILTRGHGGKARAPVIVDPFRHDARAVGDEALLLARVAPTVVARDRPSGAGLAATTGADVIIMDDGLQNPSLAKDFSLAVVDGAVGFGNQAPMPAGPLRAPLAAQWPLVDAVLVIGQGEPGHRVGQDAAARGLPVFAAHYVPDPIAAAALTRRRVLAFAGIGRPGKFFATLSGLGAEIVQAKSFPDHHRFSERDAATLLAQAARERLLLVTTEKDRARLGEVGMQGALKNAAVALGVSLPLEPALIALVQARLSTFGSRRRTSAASGEA